MVKRGKDVLRPKTPLLVLATSSAHMRRLTQSPTPVRSNPSGGSSASPAQPQGGHALEGLERVIFQVRAAN